MLGVNYIKFIYKELVTAVSEMENSKLQSLALSLLKDPGLIHGLMYDFVTRDEDAQQDDEQFWTKQAKLYRRSFQFEFNKLKEKEELSEEQFTQQMHMAVREGLRRGGCVDVLDKHWGGDNY